jgi:hypothetical protein
MVDNNKHFRVLKMGVVYTVMLFFVAGTAESQETNDAVFLHHSCGQNWLDNSLNAALVAKGYIDERNDIYYGTSMSPDAGRPSSLGGTPGDNTNMNHWIRWFNDYLLRVRAHGCANGYNRIVMFKSCYPASGVGSDGTEPGNPFSSTQTITNYKAVYRHPGGSGNTYSNGGYIYKPLEDIFAQNPDILFIPVTAPPLHYGPSDATNNAAAHRARVFNNWLKNDWLASYNAAHPGLDNVAVFDWFNILAYPDDHASHPNRLRQEYGGDGGDSHPNAAANAATTAVFATDSNNFLDLAWTAFNTNSVEVQARIYLQGPYSAPVNGMSTYLQQNNQLPLTAPYAENPRSVTSIPAGVTDWLLAQLRSTPDGPALASRSVFLRNDGALVSDLGSTPRFAMDAGNGDYYLVLKHRNHGRIMSQARVSLQKGSSNLYDFTSGSGQFHSSGEAVELETGVWGMWTGDINQDGQVTTSDYVFWYNSSYAGESGYRISDLNQDALINIDDFQLWSVSAQAGNMSAVP